MVFGWGMHIGVFILAAIAANKTTPLGGHRVGGVNLVRYAAALATKFWAPFITFTWTALAYVVGLQHTFCGVVKQLEFGWFTRDVNEPLYWHGGTCFSVGNDTATGFQCSA
jgi:hypothetical protein